MTAVNPLPNILTWIRIVAGLVMFTLLAGAAGGVPFLSSLLTPEDQFLFQMVAFWAFVLGALTDLFDGMAARMLKAETAWGATLDPIADKILVCGTILGLFSLGPQPQIAVPSALILFREFTVSALRESAASRGITLKVTWLAKWKTTVQLVALGMELLVACWPALNLEVDPNILGPVTNIAHGLMWVAAALTLWTGWEYVQGARKSLSHEK
jgi:CDP-diacylglycerol--glycerol-3-phosphate 3-phosphatidyltransferase